MVFTHARFRLQRKYMYTDRHHHVPTPEADCRVHLTHERKSLPDGGAPGLACFPVIIHDAPWPRLLSRPRIPLHALIYAGSQKHSGLMGDGRLSPVPNYGTPIWQRCHGPLAALVGRRKIKVQGRWQRCQALLQRWERVS